MIPFLIILVVSAQAPEVLLENVEKALGMSDFRAAVKWLELVPEEAGIETKLRKLVGLARAHGELGNNNRATEAVERARELAQNTQNTAALSVGSWPLGVHRHLNEPERKLARLLAHAA